MRQPVQPTIRQARAGEADTIAEVYLRSFRSALPSVRLAHDDGAVHTWFRDTVVPLHETWVAEDAATLVGMMVLKDGWLDQLYIAPERQARGLGSRFVALAKTRRPKGLDLYTFQVNSVARAFYEKHGFRAEAFGDGSGNEENEPDVRYAWRP